MAEPTLSPAYNTIKQAVGLYLGWNRTVSSHTSTNNTDFAIISASALREFYYPAVSIQEPLYEWSWLQKAGTITLAASDFDYDLPDDFSGVLLDDDVTYAAGEDQRPLTKVSEGTIRKQRSNDSQVAGFPKYYSVRVKATAPTTGQRYEMLVYPTPSTDADTKTLSYRYSYTPNIMDTTNIYSSAPASFSEVLLSSHLAAAERIMESNPNGPYNQRFQTLLASAIRLDRENKATTQSIRQ